jgi:hypothetical protein
MNRRGTRLGLVSVLFAALAVASALWYVHFESICGAVSAHVLEWFDVHGFVRQSDSALVPEMRNPSTFLLTDPVVLRWINVHAWWFAACAMLFSIWAEFRREATLYLSAGYVLGAMALLFLSPAIAVSAMVGGVVCVGWLRRRAQRLTPPSSGQPSAAAHAER